MRIFSSGSRPRGCGLAQRLRRGWDQLVFLNGQLAAIDADLAALTTAAATETRRCAAQLQTVQGVGPIGAWCLSTELFGWRQIRNGREPGA